MKALAASVTGESISGFLRVEFDRRLKLQFHCAKLSSDGGLLLYRELDETLGLTRMVSWELRDSRTGKNSRHNLLAMFRFSLSPAPPRGRPFTGWRKAKWLCLPCHGGKE
jgi:hypothetical protein